MEARAASCEPDWRAMTMLAACATAMAHIGCSKGFPLLALAARRTFGALSAFTALVAHSARRGGDGRRDARNRVMRRIDASPLVCDV